MWGLMIVAATPIVLAVGVAVVKRRERAALAQFRRTMQRQSRRVECNYAPPPREDWQQ